MKGTHRITQKLIASAKAEQLLKANKGASKWFPSKPKVKAPTRDAVMLDFLTPQKDYAGIKIALIGHSDLVSSLNSIFITMRGKF